MVVTIDETKRHLNLDEDFVGDDLYITDIIKVSEYAVMNRLRMSSIDSFGDNVPPPIRHAILLFISNLYNNRDPVAFGQPYKLPMSIDYLLNPYVNYCNRETR